MIENGIQLPGPHPERFVVLWCLNGSHPTIQILAEKPAVLWFFCSAGGQPLDGVPLDAEIFD